MNGNLGRDKIWTEEKEAEIWPQIDKTLKETVAAVRMAQKVFRCVLERDGQFVPNNQVLPVPGAAGGFFVPQAPPLPYLEISTEFMLDQAQKDGELTMHTAIDSVRDAARRLAQAEDLLIFNGQAAVLPAGINVANIIHARNGLLGAANFVRQVACIAAGPPRQWGVNIYTEVMLGKNVDLEGSGHTGPFALILASPVHGDTTSLFAPGVTIKDRLLPELQNNLFSSGALSLPAPVPVAGAAQVAGVPPVQIHQRGLLVSLAGDPTTLHLRQDAVVAYNQQDPQGNYRFRVFERIQFNVRDGQALVSLEFQ